MKPSLIYLRTSRHHPALQSVLYLNRDSWVIRVPIFILCLLFIFWVQEVPPWLVSRLRAATLLLLQQFESIGDLSSSLAAAILSGRWGVNAKAAHSPWAVTHVLLHAYVKVQFLVRVAIGRAVNASSSIDVVVSIHSPLSDLVWVNISWLANMRLWSVSYPTHTNWSTSTHIWTAKCWVAWHVCGERGVGTERLINLALTIHGWLDKGGLTYQAVLLILGVVLVFGESHLVGVRVYTLAIVEESCNWGGSWIEIFSLSVRSSDLAVSQVLIRVCWYLPHGLLRRRRLLRPLSIGERWKPHGDLVWVLTFLSHLLLKNLPILSSFFFLHLLLLSLYLLLSLLVHKPLRRKLIEICSKRFLDRRRLTIINLFFHLLIQRGTALSSSWGSSWWKFNDRILIDKG